MDMFDKATHRFLHVGVKEPKPLPSDVETKTLHIQDPTQEQGGPELAVRVHVCGSGPAALLVHGWRSQAADLPSLSSVLVDAGYRVWMPDLPGHGHSDGEHLSIPLAATMLQAVQAQSGPFALAVGHSYGGASLVHAMFGGLQVQRVALLAAPAHYGRFARQAALQAGMPQAMMDPWLAKLGLAIGCHPDEIDMKRQARSLEVPALLMHSRDDGVAPFNDMAEVASEWRGAKWLPLDGLGHFRVLTDAGVLGELRSFANLRQDG
jgi:pimeloyl-ACP methyl ester carboxylesterase